VWVLPRLLARSGAADQRLTVPDIARGMRSDDPADYQGEDEAVTIRRLYRISAKLKRERR
jgi:hypothetical protein